MNPKISVVVPVYKVERYLPKCIDSILNQTYRNLEIILVNDGSPDYCGTICNKYAEIDERICVIHKENGGLSDARNAGLRIATGRYISFIDSDDYIHSEFYRYLLEDMIENKADIVQCGYTKVTEESDHDLINESVNKLDTFVFSKKQEILDNLYNQNYGDTVVIWNKLFKLNLFQDIEFPKGKVHEDELTTYKLLYQANKLVIMERKMYYYLQRTSSIMGAGFNHQRLNQIEAYDNQWQFYHEHGLIELQKKALRRLESLVRGSINRVIIYDIDNRDVIINKLIQYYKDHLQVFELYPSSMKTKLIRNFYRFMPVFLIRRLYIALNFRRK
ncbi:glycosyltransferase family 2 protein [Amphibacillus cookii]|uniref:glycosyltransferase family 2 protein n=1 Tax=Amphibacillus cookii TaxID=767787 RepID=UPI001957E17F|nr:glycosyltransferase [Amphibacillus cookii]MBM7540675.1 glycosyltransferase involved in cell wall biosynthesis [Amphibacillus cookii]